MYVLVPRAVIFSPHVRAALRFLSLFPLLPLFLLVGGVVPAFGYFLLAWCLHGVCHVGCAVSCMYATVQMGVQACTYVSLQGGVHDCLKPIQLSKGGCHADEFV